MLYSALLYLLPASFRGEYGSEMRAVYARRRRDVASVFGWLALWLETVADVIVTAIQAHWDVLRQDLRHTSRTLRNSPGFTLTVIAVTALGVGATTAAFSITDHVLIRPLPFPDSQRLVTVWERVPNYPEMEASPANYRDWKHMSTVFESMGAYRGLAVNLSGDGQPSYLQGSCVTADVFPLLGVKPALGRVFSAEDDRAGAAATVILSDTLWRSRFGADPGVLNKKLILDGKPYIVIGVMRPDFYFPDREVALWAPMRFENVEFEDRNDNYLNVIGRLSPGTTSAQALVQMNVVASQLEKQYPKENAHVSSVVENLRDQVSHRSKLLLYALVAASLCLLLIACTNLANLLLARGMVRRKEIAVRTALGAGRERLVRQLLTESFLLAVVGGALGLCLAVAAAPLLAKLVPNSLPIAETPAVDFRVLAFAALITTLTGVGFGTIPAMRSAKSGMSGMHEGTRSGVGRRRERLRGLLVVGQVTSSVVLLISCGLLIRALWRIESTNPGFQTQGVLTMRTSLPMPKYEATAKRTQFYEQVLSGVQSLPGISSAAYVTSMPIVWRGGVLPVSVDGKLHDPTELQRASMRVATPGYFKTMAVPLLAGRDVSDSDTLQTLPVAVVSESFVRRYWPNGTPLGRHFNFAEGERTVVGVVGNVRVRGLERTSEPQVYLPYKQMKDDWYTWYAPKDLAIRLSGDPSSVMPAIRRIIASADPEQPISDVQTLSDIVSSDSAPRAVQVRVLGGFALLAFLLAGVGIHGLLSFAVSSRAQEIGVRIAMGAESRNIFAMVLREGAVLCGLGVVVGLGLAYAAAVSMQSVLAGVKPADPPTFIAGICLAALMTLAGSLLPALRAIRVDPISVIRE
jgi:predicted permease